MKKLQPNQQCPCGSGKKVKQCHRDGTVPLNMGPVEVQLTDGTAVMQVQSVRAVMISKRDEQIQGWLLERAAEAVHDTLMPGATDLDCLTAVLVTAAAAEGLVNRLLEPLMPAADWDAYERKARTQEKWIRLYEELKLSPPLKPGEQPLRGLIELFELRNDLMHLKHGKNIVVGEQLLPVASKDKVYVDLDLSKLDPGMRTPIQDTKIRERLAPALASARYDTVRAMLMRVLAVHPDDPFKVVERLKVKTGSGKTAPSSAEIQGQRLSASDHVRCRDQLAVLSTAVNVLHEELGEDKPQGKLVQILGSRMMTRARDVLLGVLATCKAGLGAEAGALGRVLIEVAITASYIGTNEQRAKHFVAQGTVLSNAPLRSAAVARERSLEPREQQQFDSQLSQATAAFGAGDLAPFPALSEMANATGLRSLYDDTYDALGAVGRCDARSIFTTGSETSFVAMPKVLSLIVGAVALALDALAVMVRMQNTAALAHRHQLDAALVRLSASVQ